MQRLTSNLAFRIKGTLSTLKVHRICMSRERESFEGGSRARRKPLSFLKKFPRFISIYIRLCFRVKICRRRTCQVLPIRTSAWRCFRTRNTDSRQKSKDARWTRDGTRPFISKVSVSDNAFRINSLFFESNSSEMREKSQTTVRGIAAKCVQRSENSI